MAFLNKTGLRSFLDQLKAIFGYKDALDNAVEVRNKQLLSIDYNTDLNFDTKSLIEYSGNVKMQHGSYTLNGLIFNDIDYFELDDFSFNPYAAVYTVHINYEPAILNYTSMNDPNHRARSNSNTGGLVLTHTKGTGIIMIGAWPQLVQNNYYTITISYHEEDIVSELQTPIVTFNDLILSWEPILPATSYNIYVNGKRIEGIWDTSFNFDPMQVDSVQYYTNRAQLGMIDPGTYQIAVASVRFDIESPLSNTVTCTFDSKADPLPA